MSAVVWLNGTAGSGKTTLARAVQQAADELYLWASIDRWAGMLPDRSFASTDTYVHDLEPVVHGFHRSIRALVDAKNSVIVDHVLRNPTWLDECVQLMRGVDVLFVGVHCSAEALDIRERERGDRPPGQARRHLAVVHSHGAYDVEVDTSVMSVDECAARILAAIDDPPRPTAFEQLQRRQHDA